MIKSKSPLPIFFLINIFFLCAISQSKATHVMGADIKWKSLGNDSFLVTVNIIRDCNGIPLASSTIDVSYSGGSFTSNLSLGTGIDITPVCKSQCSRCKSLGCSFSYGIEKYALTSIIYLGKVKPCDVTLSWTQCCRNGTITTIQAGNFYVSATLNKCLAPNDNAPVWNDNPYGISCLYKPVEIDMGATDADGDSLVYFLAKPLESASTPVTYTGSYNFLEPLKYNGAFGKPNQPWNFPSCYGFHLDTLTGWLQYKATTTEVAVIAITVQEWRKDSSGKYQKIGQTTRDFQVSILNCSNYKNNPPTVSRVGIKDTTQAIFFSGEIGTLKYKGLDSDSGDSVKLFASCMPKGAVFTADTNQYPVGKFTWRTPLSNYNNKKYTFTVTAKDNGCPILFTSSRTIIIIVKQRPQLLGDVDDSVACVLDSFRFKNNTSDTSHAFIYKWDFGDSTESSDFNVAHKYKLPGNYVVSLIRYGDTLAIDTLKIKVRATAVTHADFTISNHSGCLKNNQFIFSNASTGGDTLSYIWDFGDGYTSQTKNPVHSYTKSGFFAIKLISKSTSCGIDSMNDTIYIYKEPKSNFQEKDPIQCLKVNFYKPLNSSIGFNGSSLRYTWSFGDGSFSNADSPSHSYSKAGTYIIKLIATDSTFCSDSSSQSIQVIDDINASFTCDSTACFKNNNISFIAFNDTSITSHFWNFDDGVTDNTINPSHHYKYPGTYNVKHTVSNGYCIENFSKKIVVYPLVNNNIIRDDDTLIAMKANSYQWLYNNKIMPTDTNRKLTILNSGYYSVIISDSNNCEDTSKSFYVNAVDTLKGKVSQSNGKSLKASRIYISQFSASDTTIKVIDSTKTDTTGSYQFILHHTSVWLLAYPDSVAYPKEMPTWNDTALTFQKSTEVKMKKGTNVVNFSTLKGANFAGSGFIGGKVGTCKSCKKPGPGQPIVGLRILLINTSTQCLGFALTDSVGSFGFKNLPLGNYKVWVDYPYVKNELAPEIILNSENPIRNNLKFELYNDRLELDSLTSSLASNSIHDITVKIFPNPNHGNFNLVFDDTFDGAIDIKIFNVLGEAIYRENNKTRTGVKFSQIEVVGINPGVYILQIHTQNRSNNKILIVR